VTSKGFSYGKTKSAFVSQKVFPWEKPFVNHKMSLKNGFFQGKHHPVLAVKRDGLDGLHNNGHLEPGERAKNKHKWHKILMTRANSQVRIR